MTDHGIYPNFYEFPDGQIPGMPENWGDINERLARRRPSLSPSSFSNEDFRRFQRAEAQASKEQPVTTHVIPTIEGDFNGHGCASGGYPFTNLAPLTDGTLAAAKPDYLYGARPKQLDQQVREELAKQIIPSTQRDLPMAPNFFLEAKGPDGTPAAAERQACYDGAIGARGMHALQSYQQEPGYDNNAYTITATYAARTLTLYTTHLTKPRNPSCSPEYIMTQVDAWAMTSNVRTFREGASAYRNARDWSKEKRDELLRSANERHLAQSQEDETQRLDDSDASGVSAKTGPDGQLSYESQTHDVDEESLDSSLKIKG